MDTGFHLVTGQGMRDGSSMQRLVCDFFTGGLPQPAINVWHVIYFI